MEGIERNIHLIGRVEARTNMAERPRKRRGESAGNGSAIVYSCHNAATLPRSIRRRNTISSMESKLDSSGVLEFPRILSSFEDPRSPPWGISSRGMGVEF